MVTLAYHPVFDPYHAIIRCIRASRLFRGEFGKEELEFYQFAFLFPEVFREASLTTSLRSDWKKLKFKPRFEYESRPPLDRLLKRSRPSFEAAYQTLVSVGVFSIGPDQGIRFNSKGVNPRLIEIVVARNAEETELAAFLEKVASEIPFHGPRGLKARSGLLEFRYDVV